MITAAFFDLDNTLIKGSALFHLGRGLIADGMVDRCELVRLAAHHAAYRLRGERAPQLDLARDRSLQLAAGLPVAQVTVRADRLYDRLLAPRLWPGTLALVSRHLAAGTQVWLATAAPVEIGTLIAGRLGLAGALGTVGEVRDGVWTGQLAGPLLHGPAKAAAVRALAADRGWELADCAAYSDSLNDLPLLETVGQPVVVNPERRLRRVAEARGWPVHDFRARQRTLYRGAPRAHRDATRRTRPVIAT